MRGSIPGSISGSVIGSVCIGANLPQPSSEWNYEGVMTVGKVDVSVLFEMPEGSAFLSGYNNDIEIGFPSIGSITPGSDIYNSVIIVIVMGTVMLSALTVTEGTLSLSVIEIAGTEYILTQEFGSYSINITEDIFADGQDYTIKIK